MDTNTLVGCGALVYSKSTHRYLFLLRTQKKHKNSWGLVGGGVEVGETVLAALKREIAEEIGLDTNDSKFIPLEQFTSDDYRFVYHTFLIPVDQEFIPELNHEHKGYCWVPLDNYPKPLHPGVWRTFKFSAVVEKIRTLEQVLN
jgi:8-oxo-dGTP pyrophosphatase MutT (NUDIX family)